MDNNKEDEKQQFKLVLPAGLYRVLKFLVLWVIPEAILLYSFGAVRFGWPQPELVLMILGALDTVTGGLVGVSTNTFKKM
ncbi:MAG: phage holin [Coriobacteriales bacterium]|jgi:hypothetical protein|nr:phage holin [Coriobacteriales bacterium]